MKSRGPALRLTVFVDEVEVIRYGARQHEGDVS